MSFIWCIDKFCMQDHQPVAESFLSLSVYISTRAGPENMHAELFYHSKLHILLFCTATELLSAGEPGGRADEGQRREDEEAPAQFTK